MNLSIFDDRALVEVWPSFKERVLGNLKLGLPYPVAHRPVTISKENYDTYIKRDYPNSGTLPIEYIVDLLCLESFERPGAICRSGVQNVMFLEGIDDRQYALQIAWKKSYYQEFYVWEVLGFQCPEEGVWPDWGCYREAGTRFLFPGT